MNAADLAVAGGGVLGLAIAHAAAQHGLEVAVVERNRPGASASWAAAGMLCATTEATAPGPFFDLLRAAAARYAAWVASLEDDAEFSVDYVRCGTLAVARTEAEAARFAERARWQRQHGARVDVLDAATARDLEPALADDVVGAWLYPDDHQVDNRRLVRALTRAAARRKVRLYPETTVHRVELGTDVTLHLPDGRLLARRLVVATGAWPLAGLPRPLPVLPVRGQLLAVDTSPPALHRIVVGSDGYLVPRPDGRIILGTTVEHVGYRRGVTAGGVASILQATLPLAPSLAAAPLTAVWSGLRPGSPDGEPILGPDPEEERIFYAAGAYRNGILLAPVVAEAAVAWATDRSPPFDWTPFGIGRFVRLPSPPEPAS